MTQSTIREYLANARSTDTFGRVLCDVRDHHYIVDGPVQNGCPGEEVTPAELFLSAVTACGVELVQVIAKEDGVPVTSVRAAIRGTVDRSRQARPDVTVFNTVTMRITVSGVNESQAAAVVEKFKKR